MRLPLMDFHLQKVFAPALSLLKNMLTASAGLIVLSHQATWLERKV